MAIVTDYEATTAMDTTTTINNSMITSKRKLNHIESDREVTLSNTVSLSSSKARKLLSGANSRAISTRTSGSQSTRSHVSDNASVHSMGSDGHSIPIGRKARSSQLTQSSNVSPASVHTTSSVGSTESHHGHTVASSLRKRQLTCSLCGLYGHVKTHCPHTSKTASARRKSIDSMESGRPSAIAPGLSAASRTVKSATRVGKARVGFYDQSSSLLRTRKSATSSSSLQEIAAVDVEAIDSSGRGTAEAEATGLLHGDGLGANSSSKRSSIDGTPSVLIRPQSVASDDSNNNDDDALEKEAVVHPAQYIVRSGADEAYSEDGSVVSLQQLGIESDDEHDNDDSTVLSTRKKSYTRQSIEHDEAAPSL